MLDGMYNENVNTLRSLGLPERRVAFKYTLRKAIIPTLTISGLQLADRPVLEAIFAWPGVGRVIYEAILQRDYQMIQSGNTDPWRLRRPHTLGDRPRLSLAQPPG